MKAVIVSLLVLNLSTEHFSIFGKWTGEDAHHEKIELSLLQNRIASVLYPSAPAKNIRNQEVEFSYEKTNNDSLYYLDLIKSVKEMDGSFTKEMTYCSIKFLNANKIIFSSFSSINSRKEGNGIKMNLVKL